MDLCIIFRIEHFLFVSLSHLSRLNSEQMLSKCIIFSQKFNIDLNIDQNNRDYDFFHHRAALQQRLCCRYGLSASITSGVNSRFPGSLSMTRP